MKKFILYIVIILLLYSLAYRALQNVSSGFSVQVERSQGMIDEALQE